MGIQLNESPSSTVFAGMLRTRNDMEVAVKVFKQGITSDGYATDDMLSCIAVGHHPNLMQVKGRTLCDARGALVFSLLSDEYKKLGNPPTLSTMTRDSFPDDMEISVPRVIKLLISVSSAMEHVHRKKILHGDLYAHNILANPYDHAIVGDFGAASSLYRKEYQFFDVRAFGCLIEDLLQISLL